MPPGSRREGATASPMLTAATSTSIPARDNDALPPFGTAASPQGVRVGAARQAGEAPAVGMGGGGGIGGGSARDLPMLWASNVLPSPIRPPVKHLSMGVASPSLSRGLRTSGVSAVVVGAAPDVYLVGREAALRASAQTTAGASTGGSLMTGGSGTHLGHNRPASLSAAATRVRIVTPSMLSTPCLATEPASGGATHPALFQRTPPRGGRA
ncbi:hypothetical protein EON68_02015 [archaeon]|nr:MAG: hypothetical protein EON68_02015 [archaeon]